ncbi:MAG: Fic family protein [Bacteroidetes bacterium]|nr:Fic family protein [Bacteroidota bacterium]
MHEFDYIHFPKKLLSPAIVKQLSLIHEYKGKQELYIEADSDILTALLEVAKVQSTGASNRIEGIGTSEKRLKDIVLEKSQPMNRSEYEIAGYRDVLKTIHENYDYIPITPNYILQLHRDLYSYTDTSIAGRWKTTDNIIEKIDGQGNSSIRFQPVPASETPEAVESLCTAFSEAVSRQEHDPLLLGALFILDFLCIHPFHDGNGRMSRLLTLLILYRSGFIVGKYISIEKLIENTKVSYYDTLKIGSNDWYQGNVHCEPFVSYFLSILIKSYNEFSNRVLHLHHRKFSKQDRVRHMFNTTAGKLTKREIAQFCPDISEITIERTLAEMLKDGSISKIGRGRYTAYVKNQSETSGLDTL